MAILDLPFDEIVVTILSQWRRLLAAAGLGFVMAFVASFLVPVKFLSTAQLMPPEATSLASTTALAGISGSQIVAAGAGVLNARSPGQTVIGILQSRTVQDALIDRFGLLSEYRCKLHVQARAKLASNTILDEDKRTGIVSVSAMDPDPRRARDLAKAYVEELNKVLIASNSSSAHREREFLETRLRSLKSDLDATTEQLTKFSSKNATLNPQGQGQALIEETARVQGELISAEAELSGLRTQYADDNVRVRNARARVGELQAQLGRLRGDANGSGSLKAGEAYPTLRELPGLGASYAEISRRLAIQSGLYETLAKQYELAQVQEAKDLPSIKVLDEAEVPELKYKPHRGLIAVIGAGLFLTLMLLQLALSVLWKRTDNADPMKQKLARIAASLRPKSV